MSTPTTRSPRHRLVRAVGATALGLAAVFGAAAPALAHDELVSQTIEADPATGAATSISLTFSNSIIEVGSEIVVTGPNGADATDGAPVINGPTVTQPLAADLTSGDYDAAWRVVSSDGHPIEGAFTISIDDTGEAVIATETSNSSAENSAAGSDDDHVGAADSAEHDHAGAASSDSASEAGGTPVGALIAVIVGGAAVIAGGITAATVGRKRRAQGMAAGAAAPSQAQSVPEAQAEAPAEAPADKNEEGQA